MPDASSALRFLYPEEPEKVPIAERDILRSRLPITNPPKLPVIPFLANFRFADHPPGITVSLQVEHKQFIGNGHLIGSSLT